MGEGRARGKTGERVAMVRLLVHVEGQTEENFVNELLGEHLMASGYHDVRARLAGNPRKQRGGVRSWDGVKRDILAHLKEDRAAINAVMVDYYALPQDWPGRAKSPSMNSTSGKAEYVEAGLLAEISKEMGSRFDPNADTAPSKRIVGLFPGYQKQLFGPLAAIEIGLSSIRMECPHFNRWLERLESLAE